MDNGRQPQQRQQTQLPTRVQRFVDDFANRYEWYDASGRDVEDTDSQTVLAIDRAVAAAAARGRELGEELGRD